MSEPMKPMEIEQRSFEIITELLGNRVLAVLYWVFAYFFMMNDYERTFIKEPMSKIAVHMKEKGHGR